MLTLSIKIESKFRFEPKLIGSSFAFWFDSESEYMEPTVCPSKLKHKLLIKNVLRSCYLTTNKGYVLVGLWFTLR